MSRLIDADDIKYQLLKPNTNPTLWCVSKDAVDLMPTVDAVPVVHGHWIWDDEENSYYCDICNRHVYGETAEVLSGDYQYCPYCGAMDEVTE